MATEIEIQLFGAFRQHAGDAAVRVTLAQSAATVADLRAAVGNYLASDAARALLEASVFADDERILQESELVSASRRLAVLPPVCGG